jgi:hypothetical protein
MSRAAACALILILWCSPALGRDLRTVSVSGIELSYPSGEEAIASRLAAHVPKMLEFLAGKGLAVKTPVHVLLDDELDLPDAVVSVIPHRRVRIPLKAPGVFEEAYLSKDPWSFFLFKGLCLQGIYGRRGGLPALIHHVFGEISSPNLINPPWLLDGVCDLLARQYLGEAPTDPLEGALLTVPVPADISLMSNHPEAWPGYYGYRIYGRPFMAWMQERYGWELIGRFLEVHGAGIIPIEVDLKAEKVFGRSWAGLWKDFIRDRGLATGTQDMEPVTGYIPAPFITWDHAGIHPGIKRVRIRGRYGFRGFHDTLWVSEYNREGISRIIGYPDGGTGTALDMDHLWDPGPGPVAITRMGSVPHLILYEKGRGTVQTRVTGGRLIQAPDGVIALSGPVMDERGRIAVAGNTGGNWDIWVHDKTWVRVTSGPSIEADPWWEGGTLVFSSNAAGTFQICTASMTPVTACPQGAFLPRDGKCLCLTRSGWTFDPYGADGGGAVEGERAVRIQATQIHIPSSPYTPWESLYPNFMTPDLYVGLDEVQAGLATWAQDVTGDYGLDAGARYSFAYDYLALRAGVRLDAFSLQVTRYPFVCDPVMSPRTEESRVAYRIAYAPEEPDWLDASVEVLDYGPLEEAGKEDVELSAGLGIGKAYEGVSYRICVEALSGGRTSLFGSLRWITGSDIYAVVNAEAGRTWGGYEPGHGSFRVGGNVGEGYFTSRPSRLFRVRGFSPNLLEAEKALTTGMEVFWPLANIQKGHGTLPLYLHRVRLGPFVDAGLCADSMDIGDTVAGAGVELVTSFEVAWGNLSSFRLGVAWPVRQSDPLDEDGPVVLLQIGTPL